MGRSRRARATRVLDGPGGRSGRARRVGRRALAGVAAVAVLAACSAGPEGPGPGAGPDEDHAGPPVSSSPPPTDGPAEGSGGSAGRPGPGTVPPPWLGTRPLPEAATGFGEVRRTPPALRTRAFSLEPDTTQVPPLPGDGFAAEVVDPAPADVLRRSTWQPGCPVGRGQLAWARVAYVGFDGVRRTGEVLVASRVVDDVVQVFRDLWRARFPLEEVRVVRADELDAPPYGDGNNTTGFVCRPAVGGGGRPSEHASGLAVDVNPFQNPYVRQTDAGLVVLPELASAYLDRARDVPGVIRPRGPVVRAFGRIGWSWGGDYRTLKDYHHFSLTGR